MIGSRRLHNAVLAISQAVGVLRSAGDDDAERGRGHVEALADVFADADSFKADAIGWHLWFDHLLDALQMWREALACPRRTRSGATLVTRLQPSLDLLYAGLDLVEDEGHLLVIERIVPQPFRARAVLGPLQHGDDRGQPRDTLIGRGVDNLKFGDLGMGSSDHRL